MATGSFYILHFPKKQMFKIGQTRHLGSRFSNLRRQHGDYKILAIIDDYEFEKLSSHDLEDLARVSFRRNKLLEWQSLDCFFYENCPSTLSIYTFNPNVRLDCDTSKISVYGYNGLTSRSFYVSNCWFPD